MMGATPDYWLWDSAYEWSKVMEMAQLTLDLMKAFQERLEAFATSVSVSIGFALSGAI
ncbi:MAG: hypothetical protein KA243_06670 [Candidatus Aminicenantes bacterium]|nr:hypothetical protein [Candidatus Aminicenantes bacterium]NLH75536.1 hypothetical protein [Acidobacteriota bacterium]